MSTTSPTPHQHPVAVIGAGPIGLAAAVHLTRRGLEAKVYEAGAAVGAAIREWGHVRMFSPWAYSLDPECVALLEASGWASPALDSYPTGQELVERYLEPLAARPEVENTLALDRRVVAVTRLGHDRLRDGLRHEAPFVVHTLDGSGRESAELASAVIDASGTWSQPNPLGASGIPALGERAAKASMAYGIPDVLGTARQRYAGRRVLVVGAGHSAFNALADLVQLREQDPKTTIHWAVRRPSLEGLFGGGVADQLAERGRLGSRVAALVERGALTVHLGVAIDRVETSATGVRVSSDQRMLPEVDEIVVATGFRPDLTLLEELRLDLDLATQSPRVLGPMIDPNVHSCGTVRPHGAAELAHPESGVFVVGMKSYGRAPTFLLRTGYEQVRSVVAALAGDWEAARRVEWTLPETGVCSGSAGGGVSSQACCG
jgi:thioredoxin reductase